jgi:tetratricopeptide (TPR) repeat protein
MVSFLLFILSLLSKAQAVSLAVTLVLTDYFLGRNLKDIKLWLEKIPFFVFAFIFGIVAVRAQQEGNAIVEENGYSLISRIAMAGYAFSVYIFELVAPIQLSAINPYPDIINKTFPAYYWFGLIPSLLSIFLFYKTYKTQKEIAYGIGFFIINIFLLLQLIPVGSAVHADRYAYIPSIGFFIAGFYWLFSKAEKNKNSIKVVYSFCSIYGLILLILTFQRGEVWQSAESLWNDTVEKSPKAVVAWNNRGSTLDKKAEAALKLNDLESAKIARLQAIEDFTKAVDQKPDYSNAFYNRGRSQFELGKQLRDTSMIKNSISDFTSALQIDPRFADSYLNRGLAKDELNRTQEAIKDYDMAVAINPDNPAFYSNRGVAKGKLGKLEDAVSDFNKALNLKPDDEATLSNRGYANVLLNRNEDAMKDYNRSLEMNPNEKAYYNRAALKYKTKDFEGAVADCNQAIQLNNRFADAIYQRGLAYYSLNEKDKACSDFSMATNMGSKAAEYYYKNLCGK